MCHQQQMMLISFFFLRMSEKINTVISLRLRVYDDILEQLKNQKLSKDRRYMLIILLRAVKCLYSIGIYTFPEIIKTFQRNHFNRSEFFSNVILVITEKIRKELKCDVKWIKCRAVKKGNNEDKKIIICFLLFTYREYFIKYLHDYLLENNHNKEDIQNLISDLQKFIDDAPQNINIILSSDIDKSTQENKPKNDINSEIKNFSKSNSLNVDNNNTNDKTSFFDQHIPFEKCSNNDSVSLGEYSDDYFELQDDNYFDFMY